MGLTIQILLIYGVLFIALFGGLMTTLGIPRYASIGTEAFIYLLLVVSMIARIGKGFLLPHLWYSFFYMLLISACSIALNGSDPTRAIISLRLLYRFYFFYLAITLLDFDESNLRKINMFIAILLLLQLPVVAAKFHVYGIAEKTQGAYGKDGSLTTMIPIVVIFYLAAYYFLYHPKLRFILTGIGFVLFSIVGAKRAVFFLYPFQFLAIFYFIYIKGKGVRFSKKVGALILIFPLIAVVSGSILYFNKTLNPEGKVGGSIDFKYALDYAEEYNIGVDGYGYSFGRIATTIRVSEILWNSGFVGLFLGVGPGSTIQSILDTREDRELFQRRFAEFKIGYGLTAMTQIALECGVLGVIAYGLIALLFARMCLKYYKNENDPYWKAFAAGSVGFAFSMLFFFFSYSATAFLGDNLPALYFYAMAAVYTRLKRIRVNTV
jgi:hypothetical protein